jgi:hypothetical protein
LLSKGERRFERSWQWWRVVGMGYRDDGRQMAKRIWTGNQDHDQDARCRQRAEIRDQRSEIRAEITDIRHQTSEMRWATWRHGDQIHGYHSVVPRRHTRRSAVEGDQCISHIHGAGREAGMEPL